MAGWFKAYRDITKHWLSQDMEKLGRWYDLLANVNYEEGKILIGGQVVRLRRGQWAGSLSYLSERWGCSKSTASKFLDILEADEMIERKVERKITIVTICNWDKYQGSDDQVSNDNRTIIERCPNDGRTIAERNKEEKEINNNNPTAYTHVREESTEDSYARRYREEGMWAEAAMTSHLKIQEVQVIFEEFLVEQSHNSTTHSDYSDFKRHFLNYLRVRAEVIRKQNKQNNGDNSKSSQRRGIQVVANKVEDYEGPF